MELKRYRDNTATFGYNNTIGRDPLSRRRVAAMELDAPANLPTP
ncbi:hypothetical protein OHA18_25880 [Kribbella sp. NBC_00709]|nr:hypothetical protein [Kribbella sp. NBC_00709]